MNKKKILSLIMALVMLVGVFSPLTAFADTTLVPEAVTEKVILHKILMTKKEFDQEGKKVTVQTYKDGEVDKLYVKGTTKLPDGVKPTDYTKMVVPKIEENDEKFFYIGGEKHNSEGQKFNGTTADTNQTADQKAIAKALIDKYATGGKTVFEGQTGVNGKEYTGNKIDDIAGYFGGESKEIAGVYFALKFGANHKGYLDPKTAEVKDGEGKVTTPAVKYTDGETLDGTKTKPDNAPASIEAGKYVKAKGTEGLAKLTPMTVTYKTKDSEGKEVYETYLVATDNVDEAVGGLTTANGVEFNTSVLKGDFEIDEIHDKSTYKGKEGESLTDMKAVPVKITLPLVNSEGVVKEAHVYPKNIENKPEIDKNFKGDHSLTKTDKDGKKIGESVLPDNVEANKNKKENEKIDNFKDGAQYPNSDKEKARATVKIGDKVPYEVKTKIPAKSKLATAYWTDEMTEGLTFDKDSLKITIGGTEAEATDYTIDKNDFGFTLRLTKEGLAKINNKDADVEVVLTYSATVNAKAIPDKVDENKVVFNYGNNPTKGNTPESNKPKNGELKVTKTWDDGTWAQGEKATFRLVDKYGNLVTADDLVRPDGMTDENWAKAKAEFKNEVEIGYNKNGGSYTWKYLNNDKEYKAVEVKISTGTDAEYIVDKDAQGNKVAGEIKVTNHKTNNPNPLVPTTPEVVTGGKKFVKTNQDGTQRLAGAEFYVKNNIKGDKDNGKYLVAAKKDAKAVTDAKKALDEAVEAYNKLTADEQDGQKGKDAKKLIDDKQVAYNEIFLKNATAYTWGNKDDDNVVVLTSDGEGRFEITGLLYGDYKLEEKTAPKGFAKLSGDIDFKVFKGSYMGDQETELQYNKDDTKAGYGQKIVNKKVSIPQTGGIGTVLFTVVGIGLMAGAVMAMKKNREEA